MSASTSEPASTAPVAQVDPELTGRMVPGVRMLLPQILVAGVLPVVVYSLIRPHLSSDAEGLIIVMAFPVAEILFERRRIGHFEPIGLISLAGIALGIIGALAFDGNTVLLKVRSSVITGAFGVACLVSLVMTRPAMWHLGRAFATEGDKDKGSQFDTMWDLEGVPGRFRRVTVTWGVMLVGEAVGQTVMALTLSTGTFLAASLVLNVSVLTGLIVYTTAFTRASERILADAAA